MAAVNVSRRLLGILPVLVTCLVGQATLTGCGSGDSAHARGAVVVASTDVWGSVATAVAGGHVTVKSILSGPDADPHSYQASPSDAAAITDAALVVYNGGGYDAWADRVLAGHPGVKSVDAYSFLGAAKGGPPPNEHVFYNLTVAKAVATAIAERLATIDPGHAADYRANADAFGRGADTITVTEHAIASAHPAAGVIATEPVGYYLLSASGLVNRIPPAFMTATENDSDPSPADMASALELINRRQVVALLINPQTSTSATDSLQAAAQRAGVPVAQVTETLPSGTDYLTWQRDTVNQLTAALESIR
jgi:zinc/manganese transport system substrate-binding protein